MPKADVVLAESDADGFFHVPADLDVDRSANVPEADVVPADLDVVLSSNVPADLDGDGVVGPADLGLLIAAWGPVEG